MKKISNGKFLLSFLLAHCLSLAFTIIFTITLNCRWNICRKGMFFGGGRDGTPLKSLKKSIVPIIIKTFRISISVLLATKNFLWVSLDSIMRWYSPSTRLPSLRTTVPFLLSFNLLILSCFVDPNGTQLFFISFDYYCCLHNRFISDTLNSAQFTTSSTYRERVECTPRTFTSYLTSLLSGIGEGEFLKNTKKKFFVGSELENMWEGLFEYSTFNREYGIEIKHGKQ